MIKLCTLFGLVASFVGCAATPSPTSSTAASQQISASDLYNALFKSETPAAFTRQVEVVRAASVTAYYEGLLSRVNNDTLTIDGLTTSGLHDRLQQQMPLLKALGSAYPTFGELFDALDVSPKASISETEFAELLKSSFQASSSPGPEQLGLVDGSAPSTCPIGFDSRQLPIVEAMGLPGENNDYVITDAHYPEGIEVDASEGSPMHTWIQNMNAAMIGSWRPSPTDADMANGTRIYSSTSNSSAYPTISGEPPVSYHVTPRVRTPMVGKITLNYYPKAAKAVVMCFHPFIQMNPG